FASIVDFNIAVLRSSDRHFGYKKRIDIWLTPGDYSNANLMILLSYILMGHPEWKGCKIELFAAFEASDMDRHVAQLNRLIDDGRIPIAKKNLQKIPWDKDKSSYEAMVTQHSESADLVIMGFSLKKIKKEKGDFFKKFGNVKDILFVRAGQKILITEDTEDSE
ncbi:MAG: amino acid permease, partial [Candidatus Aminicenantes bacterium]